MLCLTAGWAEAVGIDLFGDLTEVVDEADGGRLFERVVDVVDVHLALVEQVVEDIHRLHSWGALLLVAEDQVDPLVEVGGHVVALQRLNRGVQKLVIFKECL